MGALLVLHRVQLASSPQRLHERSAPLEGALAVARRGNHGVVEVQPALLHAVGKEGAHVVADCLRPRQSHQCRDKLTPNLVLNGLQVALNARHHATQVLPLCLE